MPEATPLPSFEFTTMGLGFSKDTTLDHPDDAPPPLKVTENDIMQLQKQTNFQAVEVE
jgi:hypothetical protein